ncbi:hypothetical protein DL93DRAFT_313789 [Clavulina sp. PMI_390]|nr:hypothetical protein DL93DRAFT_313789 [Clavulina sp. PMI_390]
MISSGDKERYSTGVRLIHEQEAFWRHSRDARLVDENIDDVDVGGSVVGTGRRHGLRRWWLLLLLLLLYWWWGWRKLLVVGMLVVLRLGWGMGFDDGLLLLWWQAMMGLMVRDVVYALSGLLEGRSVVSRCELETKSRGRGDSVMRRRIDMIERVDVLGEMDGRCCVHQASGGVRQTSELAAETEEMGASDLSLNRGEGDGGEHGYRVRERESRVVERRVAECVCFKIDQFPRRIRCRTTKCSHTTASPDGRRRRYVAQRRGGHEVHDGEGERNESGQTGKGGRRELFGLVCKEVEPEPPRPSHLVLGDYASLLFSLLWLLLP